MVSVGQGDVGGAAFADAPARRCAKRSLAPSALGSASRKSAILLRQGSGGQGAQPGGNGAVRKLEFRTTLSAAILSDHRQIPPFGLAGGKAAQTGKNSIVRHDGTTEEFAGAMMTQLNAGDMLVIETPGGGGYGTPPEPA